MDVGKEVPNHYKLSCLHSLFPNSFKLYAIMFILFIIYLHIIVSYFCIVKICEKETITLFTPPPPSR